MGCRGYDLHNLQRAFPRCSPPHVGGTAHVERMPHGQLALKTWCLASPSCVPLDAVLADVSLLESVLAMSACEEYSWTTSEAITLKVTHAMDVQGTVACAMAFPEEFMHSYVELSWCQLRGCLIRDEFGKTVGAGQGAGYLLGLRVSRSKTAPCCLSAFPLVWGPIAGIN